MSQTYEGGPVTITAAGVNITTGAASASATIPNDSAGNLPRYIRVSASAAAYVKLGIGSATATANDTMVQPGDALIMAISGNNKIAALQVSAAGAVQVSPLENV